jgi:alkylation response protein AidB-like acyl-CoA dehydrogenase
VLTFKN